jgi:hypothetical protein
MEITSPIPHERLEQCAAEIAKATVPLYTVSEGKPVLERSGVLFRVADWHFILTCAHYIRDRYIEEKLPAYVGRLTEGRSSLIPLHNCPMGRVEKDCVDLAVVELANDVVEELLPTNRFISIAEMDLRPVAVPALYLINGFPSADTTWKEAERGVKTLGLWYVTVLHHGELNPTTEYDARIHVVLHYGREAIGQDGQVGCVPPPFGLSGCGIWRVSNDETCESWRPEHVKLVAIQHRYDKDRDYVMGSWVHIAMQMVFHNYEELRPAMQLSLPPALL